MDLYGNCPACGESWRGAPIPEESRSSYSPPYFFSKVIDIEHQGGYDGVSEWMCPFCKTRWDRFTGARR